MERRLAEVGGVELERRFTHHIRTWAARRMETWIATRWPERKPSIGILGGRQVWDALGHEIGEAAGMESETTHEDDIETIWVAWAAAYREVYPGTVLARWTKRAAALVREMRVEMGDELLFKLLRHVVRTWSERDRLRGSPSIPLIYEMRQSFLDEVLVHGGVVSAGTSYPVTSREESRREMLDRDEFDRDGAKKHPKVGW